MKKLFWTAFIPITLAMSCLLVLGIVLSINSSVGQMQDIQQSVPQLFSEVKEVALEDGQQGIELWLQENKNKFSGFDLLISHRGARTDVLGRVIPPRRQIVQAIGERLRQAPNEQRRGRRMRPQPFGEFSGPGDRYPNFYDVDGNEYRFFIAKQARSIKNLISNQRMFWPILVSILLLAAVVAWLIARQISRPIRRLSLAAQRIAGGHLNERVSSDLAGRKDEIGVLAKDFDQMAQQVESLLGTQKELLLSQRRMLRDVSHELRSPLARIQVALGLAEKRSGDIIKPELKRIETEAEVLNIMIGKVLDLVRLQNLTADQAHVEWHWVAIEELLARVIQDANYEAQAKGVTVLLEGDTHTQIKVVPLHLTRAIENIIRNAIQYTNANSQVTVQVKETHESLHIDIRDDGPGVPNTALEKLFEPFYRVSEAREHRNGTGGVGLAIARQVVQLHRGRIWAENLATGLIIHITLPLARHAH